jgi:hypothetical protein
LVIEAGSVGQRVVPGSVVGNEVRKGPESLVGTVARWVGLVVPRGESQVAGRGWLDLLMGAGAVVGIGVEVYERGETKGGEA